MICKAGMDRAAVQVVASGQKGYKWGPCIDGHTLENPTAHCPKWIRRTREMGEKRADSLEAAIRQMELVIPFVSTWRAKLPIGKQETVECPACKGKLRLSQAACNGHVWVKCSTEGCVQWME